MGLQSFDDAFSLHFSLLVIFNSLVRLDVHFKDMLEGITIKNKIKYKVHLKADVSVRGISSQSFSPRTANFNGVVSEGFSLFLSTKQPTNNAPRLHLHGL